MNSNPVLQTKVLDLLALLRHQEGQYRELQLGSSVAWGQAMRQQLEIEHAALHAKVEIRGGRVVRMKLATCACQEPSGGEAAGYCYWRCIMIDSALRCADFGTAFRSVEWVNVLTH